MSKKHICFYSNKCQWSKAFLQELAQTSYKNDFNFICVDPSPNRPKLPDWLKKVPTLIINGENEPRTDGEVFNWIGQQRILNNAAKNGAQQQFEPAAFVSSEMGMGGGSDPYSFLDADTSAQGNGGYSMAHSYEFIGGGAGPGMSPNIPQPTIVGTNDKKSKKEEMFDKQMELYMKSRDTGMPQPIMRS